MTNATTTTAKLPATRPTNADYLADALRQHYAAQDPSKTHVPIGLGVFAATAALSAIPLLPFAAAGLVAWDYLRRRRKANKKIADSYINPAVLWEGLKPNQQDIVMSFATAYPLHQPAGTRAEKKNLPRAKQQQWAGQETTQSKTQETVETTKTSSTPNSSDEVDVTTWQPEDLPDEFIRYLASQIHILISATTGSGKTWLLRTLCSELANRGHTLVIADPKGSQWYDLTPARLLMRSGMDYVALLRDLEKELDKRMSLLSKGQPVGDHLWAVFDEWMLFKGKAQSLDGAQRTAIEQKLLALIAAGRELNLHLIMVNQSHLLGDLSLSRSGNTFSSGLRDNLCTLGLGCKTTQDNAGRPMQGNSKSIDSILDDRCVIRDNGDRDAARQYHADLRRDPQTNRTFALYASRLYIGLVPDLTIPKVQRLKPFIQPQKEVKQND